MYVFYEFSKLYINVFLNFQKRTNVHYTNFQKARTGEYRLQPGRVNGKPHYVRWSLEVDYDYNNDDANGSGRANIDEIIREKQKPSIDISAVPVASPVVMEQLVTTCGAVIVGFVS